MAHNDYTPTHLKEGTAGGKGTSIPGNILTAIVFILEVVFMVFLVRSGMVPQKYCIGAGVILVLFAVLIRLLMHTTARKGRFIVGLLIALLVGAVMVYGIIALQKVSTTLEKITTTRTETSEVSVYVLTEDPAESLEELAAEVFGILDELDRESTDGALDEIGGELGVVLATQEYESIISLVDGLYAGEVRAIVMNQAFIDVLEEYEGYEDIEDRIRELSQISVTIVTEVEVEVSNTTTEETEEIGEAFILYLSGDDSRTGLTAKGRSDVNILAVINTSTHQVLLVSTPRDYYVELSISNGKKDKLTHAGIYGIQVSMDTLGMLYDVEINYYFKVCFEGVVGVVDALGGVTVWSDYAFTAKHGGYTFSVGYNDMTGAEALGFVRERYSFSEGDRQRGKNQLALIKGIVDKALSPSILVNYASILSSVEDCFDTNLTSEMIASLVNQQLDSGASWDIISYSVNGTDGKAVPYSSNTTAYVMIPDESTVETAKEMIQAVLAGEIISDPE